MKKIKTVFGCIAVVMALGVMGCKTPVTESPKKEDVKVEVPSVKKESDKKETKTKNSDKKAKELKADEAKKKPSTLSLEKTEQTAEQKLWNEKYSKNTRIYEIQGNKHLSSMEGMEVENVPGVVTGIKTKYDRKSKSRIPSGFYMQDFSGDNDKKTSDGIFVYINNSNMDLLSEDFLVGDSVLVSGKVFEYAYDKENDLTFTQIVPSSISEVSKNHSLPSAKVISYKDIHKNIFNEASSLDDELDVENETIDYYESLEFMRVTVENPKIVASPYRSTNYMIPGDTTACLSNNGGVVLNEYGKADFLFFNPITCMKSLEEAGLEDGYRLKGGDSFIGNITGVMDYSYSNYEIEMTEKFPKLIKAVLNEGQMPSFNNEKLNIVSYNLENFSGAERSKADGKGRRGRAQRFANEFINKLNAPDVLCLIEIQDNNGGKNDGTVEADETLSLLLEEIEKIDGAPSYKAVNIDPEDKTEGGKPGANIRCCYLYRTDRIELVEDSDKDFSNSYFETAAVYSNNRLEQNPARIGPGFTGEGLPFENTRNSLVAHFKFLDSINEGKDFIVINNHFSSKRGDAKIWGCNQPSVRNSEKRRHEQSKVVNDFIKTTNGTPVISVGDYNDFWFSETVNMFKTENNMKNIIDLLPMNERYTYAYSGYSQTLDNILVKGFSNIDGGILHLNSIKTEKEQLSDHDPVWAQLAF